jgi:hypothetical protein
VARVNNLEGEPWTHLTQWQPLAMGAPVRHAALIWQAVLGHVPHHINDLWSYNNKKLLNTEVLLCPQSVG